MECFLRHLICCFQSITDNEYHLKGCAPSEITGYSLSGRSAQEIRFLIFKIVKTSGNADYTYEYAIGDLPWS
jgi:hypothetical protein